MKVCRMCGSTYGDRVDFCFQDGTPLVAAEPPVADVTDVPDVGAAVDAPDAGAVDVPEPAGLRPADPTAAPAGPGFGRATAM